MYQDRPWFVEEEEEDEEEEGEEDSFPEDSFPEDPWSGSSSEQCFIVDPVYADPVGLPNSGSDCFLSAPIQCMLASPVLRAVFTDPQTSGSFRCTDPMKDFAELARQVSLIGGQGGQKPVLSPDQYSHFLRALFSGERADWCGEAREAVTHLTHALTTFPSSEAFFSLAEERFQWAAPTARQPLRHLLELSPKMVQLEDESKYTAISWRDSVHRVALPGGALREIYAGGQGTSPLDVFRTLEADLSWFSTWIEMSSMRWRPRAWGDAYPNMMAHKMQIAPQPVLQCGTEPRPRLLLGTIWVENFRLWEQREGLTGEYQERVVYYPPTGWVSFSTGYTPCTMLLPMGGAIVNQPVNSMHATLQGSITQNVQVTPDAYVIHVGEYHWVAVFQAQPGEWWLADDDIVAPLSREVLARRDWRMEQENLLLVKTRNVLALVRNVFVPVPDLPRDMDRQIVQVEENIADTMNDL